ncbi:hypothetical protein ACFLV6_02620 [Chloroflexota bacterium]
MGIFGVVVVVIAVAWMIGGIIWAMKTGKEWVMLKRSAIWGLLITGFGSWIFAINSMLSSNEVGAGVCLLASTAAFGIIAFLASGK